eukprot:785926-Rhodomonas_salina.2
MVLPAELRGRGGSPLLQSTVAEVSSYAAPTPCPVPTNCVLYLLYAMSGTDILNLVRAYECPYATSGTDMRLSYAMYSTAIQPAATALCIFRYHHPQYARCDVRY